MLMVVKAINDTGIMVSKKELPNCVSSISFITFSEKYKTVKNKPTIIAQILEFNSVFNQQNLQQYLKDLFLDNRF
jgi:hypothetical protein